MVNSVGVVALFDVFNGQLSEIIAVRSRQHLLEMSQVGHHGNNVILNVTQVESDVHSRSDSVIGVAALGETSEDICLSTQQLHETHDVLPSHADLAKEGLHVIIARYEDLIFNDIGLTLDLVDNGSKGIDDIVTARMSAPCFRRKNWETYMRA